MKQTSCNIPALILLAALAFSPTSNSQSLGDRPLRLVTASSAGSATDMVARIMSDRLSSALGIPVIVENKPGAQGRIAQKYVLDAPADGHTLYTYSSADPAFYAMTKDYPYEPISSFSPIAPLVSSPNVLIVSPSTGFKTVKDLIDAAKANPQAISYASVGNGSASFMNAEKFKRATGITALHVPYKGAGEATTEVIAGRVTMFFGSVATIQPHVKAGKLTALAIGTDTRSKQMPDVPTLAETGVPNAAYSFWIGLVSSAKVPAPIVTRLSEAVSKVVAEPQIQQRFQEAGYVPIGMSRPQFTSFFESEVTSSEALLKSIGIKPE